MKQTVGLIILLVGMFVLGLGVRRLLASQTIPISPVPETDTVRVIRVTTSPHQ